MAKIKEKTRYILDHVVLKSLIVYFVVWVIMHWFMQVIIFDEEVYATYLDDYRLLEFLKLFYTTWSGRVVLDGTAAIVMHLPRAAFKILDSLIMVLQVVGLAKLMRFEKNDKNYSIIMCLSFMFPYLFFYTCGFSVASIYYLWPATAGIWAVYFCTKEKNNIFEIIIMCILLTIANSMEQILIVTAGTVGIIWLVSIVIKKRHNIYAFIGVIISFLNLLFTIASPGRGIRYGREISLRFPSYEMIGTLQKVDMSFWLTTEELLLGARILWLVVTILVAIVIYHKRTLWYERAIGLIPVSMIAICGFSYPTITLILDDIAKLYSQDALGIINLANFDVRVNYIPALIMFLFFVILFLALFLCYDQFDKMIYVCGLFFLGILSRMIIGFSPTVFASGERTFYPIYAVGIIISLMLYKELPDKAKKYMNYIIWITGGASFVSVLLTIQ